MNNLNYNLRIEVKPSDVENVREIVTSTGFFHDEEIDVAVELVEERLKRGPASGYEFIFLEHNGETIAYTCYGLIACTVHSYDLYWIATNNNYRNKGFGKILLQATEQKIKELKGKGIYVETSSTEHYLPTRMYYERNNYKEIVRFKDFYNYNDDKVVYVKYL